MNANVPLLPLILDDVPPGLILALGQEGISMARPDGRPLYCGPVAARPLESQSGGSLRSTPATQPDGRPLYCGPVDNRPLEPQSGGSLRSTLATQPPGRFLLYDSRRSGHAPAQRAWTRGQVPLDVDSLRHGWPFDLFEALIDTRSRRVAWVIGQHVVQEEVSYHPKAAIRKQLLQGLRQLVERHGGAWVRVSPYPFPYRSVFHFRIDHDEYEPDDFAAVLQALQGYEHCTTHFPCASAFVGRESVLRPLADCDVGCHGWWHHTYTGYRQNLTNIRRAIRTLRSWGLNPQGFAAPHGRWNPGLAATLEDLGIDYSSEFALAHDDVPFFPYGRSRQGNGPSEGFSSVPQIPIHPICDGVFLEAGLRNERMMADHFESVIEAHYELGEPVLLYGHPTGRLGRFPHVLRHVLRTAEGRDGLWRTTLSHWNRWWRARSQAHMRLWRAGEDFFVQVSRPRCEWAFAVEYHRGNAIATLPVNEPQLQFHPQNLSYEQRRASLTLPRRIPLPDQRPVRERLRRWLDWETVTPTRELATDTLPGLLKRGLRTLYSRKSAALLQVARK